ncbi:MAG: methyltransferase [Candidatus Thalassarchaeaceae archaeon]|nr:methyltransferase [Candidatus Thalassarchaeaceae archaeon]
MLLELDTYYLIIKIWLGLALLAFIALLFVKAPYGRHERSGWGPRIPARWGWIIMESPSIIVMTVFFAFFAANWWETDAVAIVLYALWMAHYLHRGIIWPARARISKKMMPFGIVALSIVFNGVNSWVNAEWVYSINHPYPVEWFYSWQFILGVFLFISGMVINIKSDDILFKLRDTGDVEYKTPKGWLFNKVSCPNYLGELIEWVGWAIATWSLAGLSFALWTVANLVPRAISHHKWYKENLDDYPEKRKVLIPFIF